MITLDFADHSITSKERDGVLLHTCNRTEIYKGNGNIPKEIAGHLFKVVSGLDSKVIGETAIQCQVKEAYERARTCRSLSKELHILFQYALYVGKKVRSSTGISKGAVSYSNAAVNFLVRNYKNISKACITVIGINNLNEAIISFLFKKGAETIFLGNRTYSKCRELSFKYNCQAFKLDKLGEVLARTDILISATSAPHYIVHYKDFPKNKSMTIIDLAVPKDVDPKITALKGVEVYNLEDIERSIEQNLEKRRREILKAETIIKEEVKKFMEYQKNKLYRP